MDEEMVQGMRARVAQCRRLAALILDEDATRSLRNMADAIEADLARLEAEREPRPQPLPPEN